LDTVAEVLSRWLQEKLPGATDVEIANPAYPAGAGLSNETILFDASWRGATGRESRGMVLRIKPGRNQINFNADFHTQFALMRAVHEGGWVPVAEPLWFEPEPTLLGDPFYILQKLNGRVPVSFPPYPREGWLKDASPAQREKVWSGGVRALAALHSLPVAKLTFLNRPELGDTGLDQEFEYWRRAYLWARGDRDTLFLDRAFEWLLGAMPSERPTSFSWGDARLGNMMFGDDFSVVAVMDWEQASLGGGLLDLAWWNVLEAQITDRAGTPCLEGMGGREDTVALWRSLTGADVSQLHWYEVFASFRLSVLVMRMLTLDGSAREGFNFGDNPATRFLADHLGVDRPTPVM
jgi:aminoglycoside phosphotransferase (APT) family kinase protein